MEMLKRDNIFLGFVFGVVLTLLSAGIVYLVVFLWASQEINLNKTLILSFIPPVIALRYYAKKKLLATLKGILLALIGLFIVFFIAFMK